MVVKRTSTQILQEMLEVPGVRGIIIVGKDGFVIESAGSFGTQDMDTIGASVAMVIIAGSFYSEYRKEASRRRGEDIGRGHCG